MAAHASMPENLTDCTPEVQLRIEQCVVLLSKCRHHHEMVKAIRETWGVCRRTADRYLQMARSLAAASLKENRDGLVADSYELYKSIAADSKRTAFERIKAQE